MPYFSCLNLSFICYFEIWCIRLYVLTFPSIGAEGFDPSADDAPDIWMEIAREEAKPKICAAATNRLDGSRNVTQKIEPKKSTLTPYRTEHNHPLPPKAGTCLHSRYATFDRDSAVRNVGKKEQEKQIKKVPPPGPQLQSPPKPYRSHGSEIVAEVLRRKAQHDAKRLEREVMAQDKRRATPARYCGPYLTSRLTTEADQRRIPSISNSFQKQVARPRSRPHNTFPDTASKGDRLPPQTSAPVLGDRSSRYVAASPRPSIPAPGERFKPYSTSSSHSTRSTRNTSTTTSTATSLNTTTLLKSNLKKSESEVQRPKRRKSVGWSEEVRGIVIPRWIEERGAEDWSPLWSFVSSMPSKRLRSKK